MIIVTAPPDSATSVPSSIRTPRRPLMTCAGPHTSIACPTPAVEVIPAAQMRAHYAAFLANPDDEDVFVTTHPDVSDASAE